MLYDSGLVLFASIYILVVTYFYHRARGAEIKSFSISLLRALSHWFTVKREKRCLFYVFCVNRVKSDTGVPIFSKIKCFLEGKVTTWLGIFQQ